MSGCCGRREARRWLDLRKAYAEFHGVRSCNVKKMLAGAGMTFEGRLHSGKHTQPSHDSGLRFRKIQGMIVRAGIDDTRNIARIAIHLLRSGAGENHSTWSLESSLESVSLGCSELANGLLGCSAGGECGRCGYERPPAVALGGAFADGDDCAECSRGGGATRCPAR